MKEKGWLGAGGEREAAQYLEKKGFRIVEKNLRIGGSEIDLIAIDGKFLVFIEVKSRSSAEYGYPEEFVDSRKIKKIIAGAKLFSVRKKYRDFFIRFDIVSVIHEGNGFQIDHLENAFEVDP